MPCVLLTDGDERATLAATRALGRQGIEVIVGAERGPSLAGSSKYCVLSFVYPSPYSDPQGFVTRLLDFVRAHHVTSVIPMSDIAMHVIGPKKHRFDLLTRMAIPDHKIFETISDKYNLMRLAVELQVPIPDTLFVPDGDIKAVMGKIDTFPVVVKPGCSLVRLEGEWQKTAVQYAHTPEELSLLYRKHTYLRFPSLIQRRVLGEGCGVFILMDHGTPVAQFAHRRLREKPPSGGVSVLRESIPLNKTLTDPAVRLLQHVGWHGVAMVEYKVDEITGMPVLMEVNGRLWGSLQLAIDAGVNFPVMLSQLACGQKIVLHGSSYRIGIQSRWFLGDVDHLLMRLCKSDSALHLPPGYPSKWKSVWNFIRSFGSAYHEIERFDDIAPWRLEWTRYLRSLV